MARGIRCPLRKIGNKFTNSLGETITITGDVDYKRVSFVFDNGMTGVLGYQHVKNLEFYDWTVPSVCGIGYLGSQIKQRGGVEGQIMKRVYHRWHAMLQRCYGVLSKLNSYDGSVVCDEWHNFTVFQNWYFSLKQHSKIDWHVDKDLLAGKRGKLYSPETCLLLPVEINVNLHTQSSSQNKLKTLGVHFNTKTGKYISQCHRDGKNRMKSHATLESAKKCYKLEKEKSVRDMAEKFKGELDLRAYEALSSWELPEQGEVSLSV